jgi:hypothetical protein
MWIAEDVDPRVRGVLHRLPRPVDVGETRTCEAGDGGAPYGLGDRLDRLEVALARDRETRLDHVDAESSQLLRDLELLSHVEGDPR